MHKISLKLVLLQLLLFSIGLFLLSSCNKTNVDGRHPLFIKARNCFNRGDYPDAIKYYKDYLKVNPDSAKTNYQLGVIYQEQGEYIQSIFFYEKYLTLEPESSDKKIIEKWIDSSRKQLAKKLEEPDIENEKKLTKELNKLKTKNEKMRQFILRHKETIYSNNKNEKYVKNSQPAKNKEAQKNKSQIYIVKTGDTFYDISKKAYGTAKYYKYIMRENKISPNSSSKLMPGDKLIIPPAPPKAE